MFDRRIQIATAGIAKIGHCADVEIEATIVNEFLLSTREIRVVVHMRHDVLVMYSLEWGNIR